MSISKKSPEQIQEDLIKILGKTILSEEINFGNTFVFHIQGPIYMQKIGDIDKYCNSNFLSYHLENGENCISIKFYT